MRYKNLFSLICLLSLVNCAHGDGLDSPYIDWMHNQQNSKTGLLDSYERDGREWAYLYDQALAIIAFTEAGELQKAKMILETLERLQLDDPDGAWYECYDASRPDEFLSDCSKYITGPIAWMVIAINYYENKTGDAGYANTAHRALIWLDTMRNNDPDDDAYGSLAFSNVNMDIMSTEHNVDAYSAFNGRGELDSNESLLEIADNILDYLSTKMWAPATDPNSANIFWRGFNDYEYCTDTQSWAVLSLGYMGPNNEEFYKSLDWLYDNPYGSTRLQQDFNSSILDVDGFKSCTNEIEDYIWVEATEGVVAAFYSIGQDDKGDYFHAQSQRVATSNSGMAHTFSAMNPDLYRFPENYRFNHVASVAWYYFNEKQINPFLQESVAETLFITKVDTKAGKSRDAPNDSIKIYGKLYADLNTFSAAESVILRIYTIDNQEEIIDEILFNDLVITDDQFTKTLQRRTYHYIRPNKDVNSDSMTKRFTINFNKHSFSLIAERIDLTGLRLPFKIHITIGDYQGEAVINDENKVNGPRKLMPIQFLSGYDDALQVDSYKLKFGRKDNSDTLMVKGGIAVSDTMINIWDNDIQVSWGDYRIVLDRENLFRIRNRRACRFVKSDSSDPNIATAMIDLDKGSYIIKFKNADIGQNGNPVGFNLSFGSFNRTTDVLLPQTGCLDKPIRGLAKKGSRPLDEWVNMRVSADNGNMSNLVHVELKYDLDRLWYFIIDDTTIDLDIYHHRERLHEIIYFWVLIYGIDNNEYVDGEEGVGNQFIGGYYWGLFPNVDGSPINADLLIPNKFGPGRYRIEVKTRLGTWDYSWLSPCRSNDEAVFVVDNFIAE